MDVSLPIRQHQEEIKRAFESHPTLIIMGETGSGKSTQVPQIILPLLKKPLVVTQPRRVAAISLASRVASELHCKLGTTVGYAVRFEEKTCHNTRIKYVTDGLLLKELVSDPLLRNYECVILDEAHERTLRTDILLGMLRDLQQSKRKDLKIIIMSATLDPFKFSAFFSSSKVLSIPGRTFPVRTFYSVQLQADYLDACLVSIFQLHREKPPGDILVFLTGQEEIDLVKRILDEYSTGDLLVCPIYAALPSNQQMAIFAAAPKGHRKVILATNIAETSITIPGVRYVIDPGFVKLRSVQDGAALELLTTVPVSKASARQRSGRAGREAPGECYRLYTEASFGKLDDETQPEIQRTNLASALLLMKASGCEDVVRFGYLDPPEPEALVAALEELVMLDALDENGNVTASGRLLAQCPLVPNLGLVLLDACELGCGEAVVTILSMLSVETIFFVPSEHREAFHRIRKTFVHPSGDHLTLLAVYEAYTSRRGDPHWCREHFIDVKSMQQVVDIRNQLVAFCEHHKLALRNNREPECILSAFTRGSLMRIALKQPDATYRTIIGDFDGIIHPASVLSALPPGQKPEVIIFHELVQTSKRFMRTVSMLPPSCITARLQ